jgi:hypothetical protein
MMKSATATTGPAEPLTWQTFWKFSKKFENFQRNPLTGNLNCGIMNTPREKEMLQ